MSGESRLAPRTRGGPRRLGAVALLAAALSACASDGFVHDGGWRRARVTDIEHGEDIADRASRGCLATLAPDAIVGHDFIVARYAQGRWWRYRTLPMPPAWTPAIGQTIWLNVHTCEAMPNAPSS